MEHRFPWVFPYLEDAKPAGAPFPEEPRLRPGLSIQLSGPGGLTDAVFLVDSGANHVMAAPWVAQAIGVDLDGLPEYGILLGGSERRTRFAEVDLALAPPEGTDAEPVRWRADVGFFHRWEPSWAGLLGQVGFFDQFTVTMSRLAMILVVEDVEEIDRRFGIVPGESPEPSARRRLS